MPTYVNLPREYVDQVVAAGGDPNEYLFDPDTMEAIHKTAAGKLGMGGMLKEAAKNVGKGIIMPVQDTLQFVGGMADWAGLAGGKQIQEAGLGIEEWADRIAPRDVRMDDASGIGKFLAEDVASGGGQLVGMMVPGGALGKVGKAAKLGRVALAGMGASMGGQEAVEAELLRQMEAGEQVDLSKAREKGLITAPVSALLESKFGAGRVLDKFLGAPGVKSTLGRAIARNVGTGALEEGSQEAWKQTVVEGAPNDLGSIARGMAVGGLVQGGGATIADKLAGNLETAAATPAAGTITGVAEAVKRQNEPKDIPGMSETGHAAFEAMYQRGETWDPPHKTDADKEIAELQKNGFFPTKEMRDQLFRIQNDPKLDPTKKKAEINALGRQWGEEALLNKASQPVTMEEALSADTEFAKQVNEIDDQIKKLDDELEKVALKLYTSTDGLAQQAYKRLVENRDTYKKQRDILLADWARKNNLTTSTAVGSPIRQAGEPGSTGPAQPGMVGQESGIAAAEAAIREGRPMPSRTAAAPRVAGMLNAPVDLNTWEMLNALPPGTTETQVTPPPEGRRVFQQPDIRRPAGLLPAPSTPITGTDVDPQAMMQSLDAYLEGEQSVPFGVGREGSGSTRPREYNFGPGRGMLQGIIRQAQRARRGGNLGSVALNIIDNEERPFGYTVAKDGTIPTQGLFKRMAQFGVPKEEIDLYKKNGLTLPPRISIQELRGELQAAGPNVNVLKLWPKEKVDIKARRLAALRHDLESRGYDISEDGTSVGKSANGKMWLYAYRASPELGEYLVERIVNTNNGSEVENLVPFGRIESDTDFASIRDYLLEKLTLGIAPSYDVDTTLHYGVNPRPEEELVDPVELLVKVPGSTFTGGHHGRSGQNAVVFVRGNTEQLPNGDKVFHAYEVQSDWAAGLKKEKELAETKLKVLNNAKISVYPFTYRDGKVKFIAEATGEGIFGEISSAPRNTEVEARAALEKKLEEKKREAAQGRPHSLLRNSNPLLNDYIRIGVKAAIQHAIDTGHTHVAFTDAATGMLTERHAVAVRVLKKITPEEVRRDFNAPMWGNDWQNGTYAIIENSIIYAPILVRLDKPEANPHYKDLAKELSEANLRFGPDGRVAYIPQEKGMRQNYDVTIPRIAEQLTGYKPKKVSFGEHWQAGDSRIDSYGTAYVKDDKGNPQKDITANVFPLDKVVKSQKEDKVKFTAAGRDQMYYSMILPIPPRFINALERAFGGNMSAGEKLRRTAGFWAEGLYRMTQDHLGKLARRYPSAAFLKSQWGKMVNQQYRLFQEARDKIAPYEELLKRPEFSEYVNTRLSGNDVKVDALPKDLQRPAENFQQDVIKWFHDVQRDYGVYVKEFAADGSYTFREARDNDAYFPMGISPKVWDAIHDGGEKAQRYIQDWLSNWQRHRGHIAGWRDEAQEALREIMSPTAAARAGGHPLFSAVRLAQGVPLPESWRSSDLRQSLLRYADRWSKDLAWADVIQKNPILRRALSVTEDVQGNSTKTTDPETFGDDQSAIDYANRELRRMGLEGTVTADTPIDMLQEGDLAHIMASYSRRPMPGISTSDRIVNVANSLASSMLLQTKSAIRDYGAAIFQIPDFVDMKESGIALQKAVESLANPRASIRRTQQAGASSGDALAQEFLAETSNRLLHGITVLANKMRTYSGRDFADQWGKAMAYETTKAVTLAQLNVQGESTLADEFGPVQSARENMTAEQIADQTAAGIVDRVAPRYDVNNLPVSMLPQNRGIINAMFKLSAWPIARYNKWYEDAVIPAYRGKPKRLFKSLLFGGLLGSWATQEFIAHLEDKKPEDLTWAEWLNLPEEGTEKAKEFWPMIFGYVQAQGTTGIFGDIGYAASKLYTGQTPLRQMGDVNPQLPLWIMAGDIMNTTASFWDAYTAGYVKMSNLNDIGDFGLEMAKKLQTVRMLDTRLWADEKLSRRERRLFTKLYNRSPRTLNPVSWSPGTFKPDPFSLMNRLRSAEDWEELEVLMPELRKRALEGRAPNVGNEIMSPGFYGEISRRGGEETARRVIEADIEAQRRADRNKQLIKMLKPN